LTEAISEQSAVASSDRTSAALKETSSRGRSIFMMTSYLENIVLSSIHREELLTLSDTVREAHRSYVFSCDLKTLQDALFRIERIEKRLGLTRESDLAGMNDVHLDLVNHMRQDVPQLKAVLQRKYATLRGV
jgi:hypothetical protein